MPGHLLVIDSSTVYLERNVYWTGVLTKYLKGTQSRHRKLAEIGTLQSALEACRVSYRNLIFHL